MQETPRWLWHTLAKEFLGRTWCELRYCEIPWANNPPLYALVDLDGSEPKLRLLRFDERTILVRWIKSIENLHQDAFLIIGSFRDIAPKKWMKHFKQIWGNRGGNKFSQIFSEQIQRRRFHPEEHPSCGTHREEWHPLATGGSSCAALLRCCAALATLAPHRKTLKSVWNMLSILKYSEHIVSYCHVLSLSLT